MQIDSSFGGLNFALRSVTMQDEYPILKLRIDTEISKYLNKTSAESHKIWLSNQISRPLDYYFAVENLETGETSGYVGLYNFSDSSAEWGRWIVSGNPMAAYESYWLILKFGFSLGLKEIFCLTDQRNQKVLNIHTNLPYSKTIQERSQDGRLFVRHTLISDDWVNFETAIKKFVKERTR